MSLGFLPALIFFCAQLMAALLARAWLPWLQPHEAESGGVAACCAPAQHCCAGSWQRTAACIPESFALHRSRRTRTVTSVSLGPTWVRRCGALVPTSRSMLSRGSLPNDSSVRHSLLQVVMCSIQPNLLGLARHARPLLRRRHCSSVCPWRCSMVPHI